MNHPFTNPVHINRALDLTEIDAIGFDLDHTLAIYDDSAVNEIAAAAARELLVDRRGYPRSLLDTPRPLECPGAGRTLAADLVRGAVVKLDAERRVLHGRLGRRWLSTDDISSRFTDSVGEQPQAAYTVYSPFELPVLWILEELETLSPARGSRAARCEDVRRMLDAAHTNGTLKQQLRGNLPRFITGLPGVAEALARWKDAGKRLFVVTNSEPDFAPGVLDTAIGPAWRQLFERVVADARKPAFFTGEGEARTFVPAGSDGRLLTSGSAGAIDAWLGVPPERVLFVGDNARSDIRSARDHGWRTAFIAPELSPSDGPAADPWGAPLMHGDRPTWLARVVRDADLAAPDVARLLSVDPAAVLAPAGGSGNGETP